MYDRKTTAFAPATVANVAVGFDVLGFALDGVGDRVTVCVERGAGPAIVVEPSTGLVADLPTDPARNTASVALRALVDDLGIVDRLRVRLRKGIPLGSGMGGSAASAVGAVVAADHLLGLGLGRERLLGYALAGEAVASGAPHADNAAPCLHGGLTAVVAPAPPRVIDLPVPPGFVCVLVHPHLRIDTREARAALGPAVSLDRHVAQSMHLAGFLAGCFRGDPDLAAASMVDLIAGPQRARLIPGFDAARAAALDAGAAVFAIAGSGPSVFAWVRGETVARAVEARVRQAFGAHGLASDVWSGPLGAPGARVVGAGE